MSTAYQDLCQEVAEIAKKAGRDPASIQIVAVTKNHPWKEMQPLYDEGARLFGESRVNEGLEKMELAPKDIKWHFIGHLQKNKVRKVVERFSLIHSVDSVELAKKIDEVSAESGKITKILLEVNISGELSKYGFSIEVLLRCFKELNAFKHVSIQGLMTMAPFTEDKEIIRKTFRGLKELKEHVWGKGSLHQLSMGMSHDYEIAIQEGATLLRIGSKLF